MTPRLLQSLFYWAKAFKVIESHGSLAYPTHWGNYLLGEEGIDPYLESLNSLYWLHFQLLQPPCHAPVWHWFFNKCNLPSFTKDLALTELEKYVHSLLAKGKKVTCIRTDLDCLTKMYSASQLKHEEDEMALGWIKLRLFSCYKDSEEQRYSFRIGEKLNLSDELIVAACVEFCRRQRPTQTIKISDLTYLTASPGNCFKLKEDNILEAFDACRHSDLRVELDANFKTYLQIKGDPLAITSELLKSCPVTCSLF